MQITTVTYALAALQAVSAHTVFTTLTVNGVSQGDGVAVRMPTDSSTATNPISGLQSNDMACGRNGETGVARVVTAPKSAKLGFTFRLWPDGSEPGAIDSSHKGSCAVYMKNTASAIKDTAAGAGWFKIWDEGYDTKTKKWCTEKLNDNNGILSVTIPESLAGGNYLVRPEILSLHESTKGDPQFYAGCAQIYLDSTATTLPSNTVSIPGYVKASDKALTYDTWATTPVTYTQTAGPAAYQPGVSASTQVMSIASVSGPTEGKLASNVILTNGNWEGIEVPSYTDETGCNAAAENCWAQATTCYSSAGATGSSNCSIWETKCEGIRTSCDNGAYPGPPNAGKVLTPASSKVKKSVPWVGRRGLKVLMG